MSGSRSDWGRLAVRGNGSVWGRLEPVSGSGVMLDVFRGGPIFVHDCDLVSATFQHAVRASNGAGGPPALNRH